MAIEFENAVLAGVTLVREAIESQNFQPGSAGWQIAADGSAEFSDVTIRGGQVTGGDVLLYHGTPALGTLFLAMSQAGGTDPYGNVYAAGLTLFDDVTTDEPVAQITSEFSQYGGGFWSRGFQTPVNTYAQMKGGLLVFDAVDPAYQAAVNGAIQWAIDNGSTGYTLMFLSSGCYRSTDDRAFIELHPESPLRAEPEVLVQDQAGGVCNLTVAGSLSAANRITGKTSITPSAANTPTSKTITFPTPLQGTNFTCQVSPETAVPGTAVTGVGYNGLSATGVTLWLTRTNTTTTNLSYTVEGTP